MLRASEKQGLTQRFAQQTRVCPDRFSHLKFGNTLGLIFMVYG
jgi:hypothetical protein